MRAKLEPLPPLTSADLRKIREQHEAFNRFYWMEYLPRMRRIWGQNSKKDKSDDDTRTASEARNRNHVSRSSAAD